LFACIALVVLASAAQSQQHPWPPVGDKGVDYFLNSKDKPNGLHYRTYGDGKLYYSGEFFNKQPKARSSFYYYHPNGKVMAVHNFRADIKRVDAQLFNEDGKLMSKGVYQDQKKDSIWTFFDNDGQVVSRANYVKDELDGKYAVFLPGTKLIMEESDYKAGKLHGEQKTFYSSGKKRFECSYVNDVREGKATLYYESGKIKEVGDYQAGLKTGTWAHYLENGKMEKRIQFKEGAAVKEVRENGEFMEYYPNGIPMLEISYKDGKKHGPFKEYYKKGEFVKEQITAPGGRGMEWKEKLVGTQVQREGDYMNDLLEGDIIHYDEKGKVTLVEVYRNGELIETRNKK
jgi:uncharacterized protein